MTYDNDPNLNRRPVTREERSMGLGIPLAIAAILIAGGFLFYGMSDNGTRTASNTGPGVTTSTPAPAAPGAPPATTTTR